jgi:hypothetical protein
MLNSSKLLKTAKSSQLKSSTTFKKPPLLKKKSITPEICKYIYKYILK